MTNLERLALLLQRVTGVEAGKTPEETIKRAVQEIKASKNTDKQVKSQLSKVKLSEEEMYGGAEELPTLTDYVRNKFAGEPSTKSWKAIELANIGRIDDLKKRQLYKKKFTDYTEDADIDPRELEDNDFDFENGIDFKSINAFMDNLSDADYLDIYDDDELDFSEFDDIDPSEIETTAVAELKECEDIIATSCNPTELAETLSRMARLKLKIAMLRNKAKLAMKRKIALLRHSTLDVLKKRAHKLALKFLKQKIAHKPVADMSMADKERVEKTLKTKKSLLARLTMKLIPTVREKEKERLNKEEK